MIAFLNECLAGAAGKSRLAWKDLVAAEARYSQNRLLALRDDWKTNYPGIDRAFEVFRGAPAEMSQDEVTVYLDNVALLMADPSFEGVRWVTDIAEPVWSGAMAPDDWSDSYQPLVKFFYDLGFLGVVTAGHEHFAQEEPGFVDAPGSLQKETRYVVPPCIPADPRRSGQEACPWARLNLM